ALGVVVQLILLGLLSRSARLPYLAATAVAVELTVLHNFVWHEHFTWRDRQNEGALRRLFCFHLSNGLVSLLGNVVLMSFFAGKLRLPILLSNVLSIVICSILNFFSADRWVFARPPTTGRLSIRP